MTSRARQSKVRSARKIRERIPRYRFSRIEPMNFPLTRPSGTHSPSEGERDGARGLVRSKMPLIFGVQRLFEVRGTGLYGFAGAVFCLPKSNSTWGGVSEPSFATKYGLG